MGSLIRTVGLAKAYRSEALFEDLTLQCNPTDRIGLIGGNGVGKTTLLDLIDGTQAPDSGAILRSPSLTISRLSQQEDLSAHSTVWEEALSAFSQIEWLEQELARLEAEMASGASISEDQANRYQTLRTQLEQIGGYRYESLTKIALVALGFSQDRLQQPCGQLSGGERRRLALAKAVLRPSQLLLLDEPSNHLDYLGIAWLHAHLGTVASAYILVSHDRFLLDALANQIWELEEKRMETYPGNFSRYLRIREERRARAQKEYLKQQEWKARTEDFVRRNIVGQKTKQAKSRRKTLEKAQWLQPPAKESQEESFPIAECPLPRGLLFEAEGATLKRGKQILLEDFELQIRPGDKLGLIGPNGSGKTSLIETLIGKLPLSAGLLRTHDRVRPCWIRQTPESFAPASTVEQQLMDWGPLWGQLKLRSLAARFGFSSALFERKLSQLSGGELSRLFLMRMFFEPSNVLLLDEPTNHLDISGTMALEKALVQYQGTAIVVSHDRFFLERTCAYFLWIDGGRLERIYDLNALFEPLVDGPTEASSTRVRKQKGSLGAQTPKGKGTRKLSKNERYRKEKLLSKLEGQIATLEAEKERLMKSLESASQDYRQAQADASRHQEIDNLLADLYRRWEAVSEELG